LQFAAGGTYSNDDGFIETGRLQPATDTFGELSV
jgi:hypothetical protein